MIRSFILKEHISHFQISQWKKNTWMHTSNIMQHKKITKQINEKQQNQLLSRCVQADDWPYWKSPVRVALKVAVRRPSCVPVSIAGLLAGWSPLSARSGTIVRFGLWCSCVGKTQSWMSLLKWHTELKIKCHGGVGGNHLWVEACKERPCGGGNPETC